MVRLYIPPLPQPTASTYTGGSGFCFFSKLYNLFEHGINGFLSWRKIKAETEEPDMLLLDRTDKLSYSKYKPITKAVEFAMQHSGMQKQAQALQALDSMQQQQASRKQQPHSGSQHQQVGVSDMALGFAAIQNLDTQVEALAQQAAKGGKLQLPDHFQVKPMAAATR